MFLLIRVENEVAFADPYKSSHQAHHTTERNIECRSELKGLSMTHGLEVRDPITQGRTKGNPNSKCQNKWKNGFHDWLSINVLAMMSG
jgi:hypothetical protein